MDIRQRLINWGRWCREGQRYGHCASIEHNYRSPQCWNEPEPKPDPINIHDGQAVEWAVRVLHVEQRTILRLRYVRRYNWQALQRRFKFEDAEKLVMLAEISVKRVLQSREETDNLRGDNSNTLASRLLLAA